MKTLLTADYRSQSYVLGRKLGSGAFGSVYEALNERKGRVCAVKLSKADDQDRSLRQEWRAYQHLNDTSDGMFTGVAQAHYFGPMHIGREAYTALVMDRLGPSVESMLAKMGGRMNLRSVLMIGVQAVRALEFVHGNDILHCDIKPDNMMLDRVERRRVYLGDFGHSQVYRAGGRHVRMLEGRTQTAVPMFASLNWHAGVNASRRDDLESLGYVLVYLYRGRLPWDGLQVRETWESKKRYPIAKLCKGMTSGMVNFMMHVRGLRFEEEPDYEYLTELLVRALYELGYAEDGRFEWNSSSSSSSSSPSSSPSPSPSPSPSRQRGKEASRRRRSMREDHSRKSSKHRHR